MHPELLKSEEQHAAHREPAELSAWDCVQQGYWHLHKHTKGDMSKARALFEKATKLDPQLALGFQGLAATHYNDLMFQWTDSPEDSRAQLAEASRRCVDLDDRTAFGHWLLGVTCRLTGQPDKAIDAFKLAIQLNPSVTLAHHELGVTLAMCGRPDEALVHLEKAIRLSPQDRQMWVFLWGVALAHAFAQRYEEAVEWVQRSLQRNPGWFFSYLVLAASCAFLGRVEDARAAVRELLQLNPDFSLAGVKLFLAAADRPSADRAIDLLRKAGLPE
jgi:tetratricopeptide (TPR) repeat protein